MYAIKKEGPFHEGNTEEEDNSYVVFKWNILGSEAESKKKLSVWDPMPELTVARVDSITFTMGNPMPESILTLCQSRS